jgi:hypothetical protein
MRKGWLIPFDGESEVRRMCPFPGHGRLIIRPHNGIGLFTI